jgi:hypothetical protein
LLDQKVTKKSSQSECFPRSLPVLNAFSAPARSSKAKPSFPPYTRPARSDLLPHAFGNQGNQENPTNHGSETALGIAADTGQRLRPAQYERIARAEGNAIVRFKMLNIRIKIIEKLIPTNAQTNNRHPPTNNEPVNE